MLFVLVLADCKWRALTAGLLAAHPAIPLKTPSTDLGLCRYAKPKELRSTYHTADW